MLADDGNLGVLFDWQMIVALIAGVIFLAFYTLRTRFERHLIGWLVLANTVGWILVSVGGLLYRARHPELAVWFFIPLGFGVPAVMVAWTVALARVRSTRNDRLSKLVEDMQKDAWVLFKSDRKAEAVQMWEDATRLADVLDSQPPEDRRSSEAAP